MTYYATTFKTRTPGLCEPVTASPPQHAPTDAPRFDAPEGMRVRNASRLAVQRLGGAVGELVERELLAWANFGFRIDHSSLIMRVVRQIEEMPGPEAAS